MSDTELTLEQKIAALQFTRDQLVRVSQRLLDGGAMKRALVDVGILQILDDLVRVFEQQLERRG